MSTIEINTLSTRDTDNIIKIFSDSFENYPLMEFIFGDLYEQSMRQISQLMLDEANEDNNQLLLGAFVEGNLPLTVEGSHLTR